MEPVNVLTMFTPHKLKLLFAIISWSFLSSGCKRADLHTYNHSANIYFDLTDSQRDSIIYTFAYDLSKASDTVYIPVRLSGIREIYDRRYMAYVEQDSSTAVAGVHYEALQETYILPANFGRTYLPLIIYNTPDLESSTVSVILKLRASDDLGIENPQLIRAKIVFSAQLEEPVWWRMWLGNYSRTKHQLFILVTGQTELTMDGLDAPRNLYFVSMLTMMLNDPFAWVASNPDRGYVLQPIEEGDTTAYYFYHHDNPSRTLLLRRNASGMYYFIDENGEEVR